MIRSATQITIRHWRRALVGTTVLAGVAMLWIVQHQQLAHKPHRISGPTMGTTYTVTYRGSHVSGPALKSQLASKLDAIDQALSNWRRDSWIRRFNRRATTRPMTMPRHAHRAVRIALRLAEQTGGAMDPTIARLINLWGFGPVQREERPSAHAIRKALAATGHEQLTLKTNPPRLSKAHPRLALNVSAVAKGYAADVLAKHLEAEGINHYLVNLGGDLRAKGHPPNRDAWPVDIQRPSPEARAHQPQSSIALRDQALATSGDYRRYKTVNGKRYPHILDPRTGRPVDSALASVSVVAPTAAEADGLATACVVLGLPRARKLIEHIPHAEALFIKDSRGEHFNVHTTKGWNGIRSRPLETGRGRRNQNH
jgi:thiamine biosynthesis lipoprotein